MKSISCFIPLRDRAQVGATVSCLLAEKEVAEVYLLKTPEVEAVTIEGCKVLDVPSLNGTEAVKAIASVSRTDFSLIYTKFTTLSFGQYALERMIGLAEDMNAAMTYADHFNVADGVRTPAPVIDCQPGALRDDFDFGSVLLYRTSVLKAAAARMDVSYTFAGLYDLRLKASQIGPLVHISEFLYYDTETDTRASGEKLFDYVNPKNRGVQVEMEQVCTQHLKDIGGYLAPHFKPIVFSDEAFEYEASVVIPCKNRVRTIGDAIASALNQKTSFKYNVIVVDDNSDDGTVEIIKSFQSDPKLIYIAQDTTWHGIGGNWNSALHHPKCGRFALQLDSDDVYADENVVQRFVDAFYAQNCAMVVGTYRLTDIDLNTIPPGVIDHREWTPENGRNNALRVNGLGAPRGFYVPLMRELNFPPTKYGEDYAVGLRVSREYQIGRIYDVLYNCRRWDSNSDAALDVDKVNANNFYKDKIRTWELTARIALNQNK
ncbi:MAG: glycosyltransferase family 2 protein [Bacteroidales bacterium]|nr:glycosyltransferase family 2 protein [Bacteroidales bacterium]